MENDFLSTRTAHDIDRLVARLLADLGNPEPPLKLEAVRDRLKLHKGFYQATDPGSLASTAHCLIVAGKQVLKRPRLLLDAVRKLDLKALYLPDEKRILIDSGLPVLKQRWAESHEIAHDLIPWHESLMHGDPLRTLRHDCHHQVEAEANFGAARLLFLGRRFEDELRGSAVTFDRIRELASAYGNTITSAMWRAVELLDSPAVGLVSVHPWTTKEVLGGGQPVRYFLRSRAFKTRFSNINDAEVFRLMAKVVRRKNGGGPLGEKELPLTDAAGCEHTFLFECFSNTHETLSFGLYQTQRAPVVAAS